jgi:hypothetical protein
MVRPGPALALLVVAAVGCAGDPNYVPVRAPVASINLVPQNDSIPFGGSVLLVAQPLDASGHPTVPDSTPIWTSLTPTILAVDALGHVSAEWFGAGAVRVRIDRVEASASIFVGDPPIDSVSITPVNLTLSVGDTGRITATARNAARLPASTQGIVWHTSDGSRLTVDSTGKVQALATGSVFVWVTLAGLSDTSFVTIN